jgi:hypothetical protein
MLRRGLAVWVVIILAESLHGTARVLLLEPYLGAAKARQIAFFTGLAIILAIAVAFIRWIRATGVAQLLAVGGLWTFLTFGFECLLGRYVMAYSWERIFAEYDPRQGGLMSIGMIFLTLAPPLAAKMRKYLWDDQFVSMTAHQRTWRERHMHKFPLRILLCACLLIACLINGMSLLAIVLTAIGVGGRLSSGYFEMLNLPVFFIWIPIAGMLIFGSIALILFRRKEIPQRPK